MNDRQSKLLLEEHRLEREAERSKREADRVERAYCRVLRIENRLNIGRAFPTREAREMNMNKLCDARAVRESLQFDLENRRRFQSEYELELDYVRWGLNQIDRLHEEYQ